jgi:TonB family protein
MLVLVLLSAACVSAAPAARESGDGATANPPPGPEPDLEQAQFFARTQGAAEQLELQAASFTVQVHTGPQAIRTHLSIAMKNPGQGQVEAVLRLPIPPGAAVTRAVLWVGNRPMEGAFVARDRARTIYRSITERRRDPALITWSGPEWIEATVFPVEPKGSRLLELEWIEPAATLQDQLWYRVPVLAQEGRQVTRPDSVTMDGVSVPRQGRTWLVLPASRITGAAAVAREPGDPFGYAFSPAKPQEGTADGASTRIVLVAETSRAMSPKDRKRQSQALHGLLSALPDSTQVELLAVDWRVRTLAEALSPSKARAALDALDAIPSAGALDLQSALVAASERARVRHASHIVFVGHGLDAFGGDATAAPLQRMQEAGQMLVVMGADDTSAPLRDAAALTGGQSVPWSQAGQAARLMYAIERTRPALTLDSAETFFPLTTVTGQTRWLARFVGQAPDGVLLGVERDLEALWTRAHIAGTVDRDADPGEHNRVLTPLTSILVLETTGDYARWGIPEPRKPDAPRAQGVLGVLRAGEDRHLGAIFGRDSVAGSGTESVLGQLVGNEIAEAYGTGGLGLVGTGAGGGGTGETTMGLGNFGTLGKSGSVGSGSGYGRGIHALSGWSASIPSVVPGQAQVRGSLDKEIIRRIIRRHMNEVSYCYEQERVRKAGLEGRMSVQFVISPWGQVTSSDLQSSTLGNVRVETCVVDAVKRWEFPKPVGGGSVTVSYPFNFVSGGSARVPAQAIVPQRTNWDVSAEILRERSDLPSRVAKIAGAMLAPQETRPALLAYWLDEHSLRLGRQPVAAYVVIANLLKEARLLDEAIRVLSEAAPFDPDRVASELRRWGQVEDAKRVEALKSRGVP